MRTPLIAGNWKMNTNVAEAVNLIKQIQPEIKPFNQVEIVLCPPFISLVPVFDWIKGSLTKLGAQNLYFEEKGAYTGEISPLMLMGYCDYVILGHSERRQYFGETDSVVSQKINSAISHNLKPILCVGENLSQYESGQTQDVVTAQLTASLAGVEKAGDLVIAYEPIWAIGTGKSATGQQANATISLIRNLISKKYSWEIADNLRILYGGSVSSANIAEFVSQPDIDGALVGGASLKAADFVSIIKQTSEIRNKKG